MPQSKLFDPWGQKIGEKPVLSGSEEGGPERTTEHLNDRGDRDHRILDSMKANDVQVGGKHYKSDYQHWDFVRDMGLDYYEGCASKYLTRRKNSRTEDLQKAKHFLQKRKELERDKDREIDARNAGYVHHFATSNRLSYREYLAIYAICEQDYTNAIQHIDELLKEL